MARCRRFGIDREEGRLRQSARDAAAQHLISPWRADSKDPEPAAAGGSVVYSHGTVV